MPKLNIENVLSIAQSIPALIALVKSIKNGEEPVADADGHVLTQSEVDAAFTTVNWLQNTVSEDVAGRLDD